MFHTSLKSFPIYLGLKAIRFSLWLLLLTALFGQLMVYSKKKKIGPLFGPMFQESSWELQPLSPQYLVFNNSLASPMGLLFLWGLKACINHYKFSAIRLIKWNYDWHGVLNTVLYYSEVIFPAFLMQIYRRIPGTKMGQNFINIKIQ